jgi:hypothetical protein
VQPVVRPAFHGLLFGLTLPSFLTPKILRTQLFGHVADTSLFKHRLNFDFFYQSIFNRKGELLPHGSVYNTVRRHVLRIIFIDNSLST